MAGFTQATRRLIIERAGRMCERCGRYAYGGSIHHRRPRGMGGNKKAYISTTANGVLLCGTGTTGCHGHIEVNRPEARADGWLLTPDQLPHDAPINHHQHGFVWLGINGEYLHEEPEY